jgi:hypothetical protein
MKWLINKIIQIFNFIKAIPFLALFYFYIIIGYKKYLESDKDDIVRKYYSDKAMNNLQRGVNYGLSSNIKILNNTPIDLEKISIINCNHYHQNDILILFYLFYLNGINGSNISSISTSIDITDLDNKILTLEDAILVNKTKNDILEIVNKLKYFNQRDYNTAFITFFEGIAMRDAKKKSNKLKNLLDPKTLGFDLCIHNIKSKYIYDINLVYTHNKKLIDPKNKDFTILLIHPNTKIYVEINKYDIPKKNNSSKWLQNLYNIKDKQIDKIINKYVTR